MKDDIDGPKGGGPANLRALAEAMAHPTRAKLLIAVAEAGDEGASIRQVAERTGEPKRRVRYHVDDMHESGLLGIAAEKRKGGVVERFFCAQQLPWISEDQLGEIAVDTRRQIAIEILKAVFADLGAAARAKRLGVREEETIARMPGKLDERGRRELAAHLDSCLLATQKIFYESKERLASSGETPVSVTMAVLSFEVPPWPS